MGTIATWCPIIRAYEGAITEMSFKSKWKPEEPDQRELQTGLTKMMNLGEEQIDIQQGYYVIYKIKKKSRMDDQPSEDSDTIEVFMPYLVSVV